jgi:hypothetical protein
VEELSSETTIYCLSRKRRANSRVISESQEEEQTESKGYKDVLKEKYLSR